MSTALCVIAGALVAVVSVQVCVFLDWFRGED